MSRQINICWLIGSQEDARLLVEVAKRLPSNFNSLFLTYSEKAMKYVKTHGLAAQTFNPGMIKNLNISAYSKLEEKYGLPNLRLLYWSDPTLRYSAEEQVLPKVASYLNFFDKFFEKNRVDYFVQGISGYLVERAAYAVTKARKIAHFIMESGPIDRKGTIVLSDINENWIWSEALNKYEELQKRDMTSEENKFIDSVLNDFLNHGKMFKMVQDPSFKMIKTYIKGMFRYVMEGNPDANVTLPTRIKNEVIRWARINKAKLHKGSFDKFDTNLNYVFFPIHFIEDAQVTVREPFFYNQFDLVRQIALALPVGVLLYTKTHPDDLGGVSSEEFDKLKKIPNLRLLDPLTNSHEIIKHSKGVIAISSTAGWEAMLYRKPVVVMGDVFYSYQKDVVKVGDVRKLPNKLKEAISRKPFYNDKDWRKFIYSCMSTVGGGTIFRHYYNAPLLEQDVAGFAKTLTDKINQYERNK